MRRRSLISSPVRLKRATAKLMEADNKPTGRPLVRLP